MHIEEKKELVREQIQSWVKVGDELYECEFCKTRAYCSLVPPKIGHLCQAQPTPVKISEPSSTKKAFNFIKALARHAGDGFKKRTKEQIEVILETHCNKCRYFNGVACTHEKCGCNVNREEQFFNKIAWASEKCPIDKW